MKQLCHRNPVFNLLISCLVITFICSCHPTLGHQCIDSERDALLKFKQGIDVGRGFLYSWQPNTDCCQWVGVGCSNQTGHVVKLSVVGADDYYQLYGQVSPSLGELTHLKFLNLSYNSFYTEIPSQLGNLSQLTTLDLSNLFSNTRLSFSWISRLSLLRYLDVSQTNLSTVTDWVTVVNNLRWLRVLRMDSCELHANIPSSLSYINSSTTLHTISLSDNFFNDSSILKWLLNFPRITTQLEYLNLHGNAIQGSALKITSKLCNLKQLDLGSNRFAGDDISNVIDSVVGCNNETLTTLDLSQNGFSGTIPDIIDSFTSLRDLFLEGNRIKGEINQGIGKLSLLEKLDLSDNYFEGTLTDSFFVSLANLRELYLSGNPGVGITTREDWIPPFQLDVVGLNSCKLGPRFPKWLQLQTNCSLFDISNTSIFDSTPTSFWTKLSSNVIYLNMSSNQFYGTIPNLQGKVPYAYSIDLSSNLFEGIVPSGFAYAQYLYLNDNRFVDCSTLCPGDISQVDRLDLSNNLFSGELPDCWKDYAYLLTSLHLENNNFSGHIPDFIGGFESLEYVHMENNSFSGSFPTAFKGINPSIINLGYNLFSGHIPSWMGNHSKNLGALILRNNKFTGEIPESLCQSQSLQILDLAGNQISGVIPGCIGHFSSMKQGQSLIFFDDEPMNVKGNPQHPKKKPETADIYWKREVERFKETIGYVQYMDLSSNELSGEIPDEISSLNGLQSLDLSNNKLKGNIPLQIGNLTALEFLDLSDNHLTGGIPTSLAEVTALGTLDVSNNNLSGEIPVSTQLQSFNASSYAGNPGLCGAPLPSCLKDGGSSNLPNGDDDTNVKDKDGEFGFFLGLFISVALGFIIGFWGVCGTLVIKTSWRHAYFRFIDNIKDRVF